MSSELITWIPVADRLPDCEITVLVYDPNSNEPVWLGYHDGDDWRNPETLRVATPTHWADMPGGPNA